MIFCSSNIIINSLGYCVPIDVLQRAGCWIMGYWSVWVHQNQVWYLWGEYLLLGSWWFLCDPFVQYLGFRNLTFVLLMKGRPIKRRVHTPLERRRFAPTRTEELKSTALMFMPLCVFLPVCTQFCVSLTFSISFWNELHKI